MKRKGKIKDKNQEKKNSESDKKNSESENLKTLPKEYFKSGEIKGSFQEVWSVINILRKECPWDRNQTSESVKFKLVEEAYEAIQCIDDKNWEKFKKEIGDVILVALFHIKIMEDEGKFSLEDVFRELIQKLIQRHPHVFGERELKTPDEVLRNWEKSKGEIKEGEFNLSMPALYLTYRVVEKLKHRDEIGKQDVKSKIGELMEKILNGDVDEGILAELLFLTSVIAVEKGINPEDILRKKVVNFLREISR
jgi:uncharacterized protein YabN with tetrapyrrole methylase and pyrophosphatase domain